MHKSERRKSRGDWPKVLEIASHNRKGRRLRKGTRRNPLIVDTDLITQDSVNPGPPDRHGLVYRQHDKRSDESGKGVSPQLAPPGVLGAKPEFADSGKRQAQDVVAYQRFERFSPRASCTDPARNVRVDDQWAVWNVVGIHNAKASRNAASSSWVAFMSARASTSWIALTPWSTASSATPR
jgi:hypothetical protein